MRVTRFTMAMAVAGLLPAGSVMAQHSVYESSVQPTAYEYGSYYAQEEGSASPSDAPLPAGVEDAPAVSDHGDYHGEYGGCSSCDSGCDTGCDPCSSCGCDDEPWKLFPGNECSSVSAGGWVAAGIYGSAHGANRNGPIAFRDTDEFTFNQVWAWLERSADNGGCGWDWGFRVDYVFGADGPDTQAFGDETWDFGWNSGGVYGSAIPQLYGVIQYNDWTWKLGRFYTIIGYEVVQAPDNFFTSYAYTMNYGEPFTHMGALGEYAANDNVTIYAGWTAGWDAGWENDFDASTFLGGVSLTLSENTTFTWAVNVGDFGNGQPNNEGDIYMNSFVLNTQLSDNLTYVFQHDLGSNENQVINAPPADVRWHGINQYLFYTINDCWTAGARFEWFDDEDGQRVVTNAVGDYYALTLGLNYRPNANLVIRPEIRWDWFDDDATATALPFDNGTEDEQFSGGFDFIVTF